ncbi:MAG: patatin-like phospholipase family protein [Pseudomonadota bacterium]
MSQETDNSETSNLNGTASKTAQINKPNTVSSRDKRTINLALQGGGAHGAFAWGVLDKIIEDGRLDIEGLCATSAGTMNACVYAYGMMKGGADLAREKLHDFWWNIHQAGQRYNPVKRMPWEKMISWNMDHSIAFFMFDSLTRAFSPYQLNPLDINPLRDVLEETVDFDELRACKCTKMFISATHVRSGKVRVFENENVTLDVAMASACLPFLFKAVEIDGEDYWDGGYMGNPALFPLFYNTESRDIMIVHINPIEREDTPTTGPDIMNRVNEISFNSSLIKELRAIAFVKKLLEKDMIDKKYREDFKDVLVHSIRADKAMAEFSVASKFDSDWDFLLMLRDTGRETMQTWLDNNFDCIGVRDTIDLQGEFLHSVTKLFDEQQAHHEKNAEARNTAEVMRQVITT